MPTFVDLYSELIGVVPHLPPPLAQKFVNRAFMQIQEVRLWSWLITTGVVISPAIIKEGLVSVTEGSNTVNLSPEAAAVISAAGAQIPVIESEVLGVGRQFRVYNAPLSSPIYSISTMDLTPPFPHFTLDRLYAEPTAVDVPYQIYKCYYAPPTKDFLKYITITNVESGYTIRDGRLNQTQTHLNAIDAARGTQGDAYQISYLRPSNVTTEPDTGQPVHEWYPHPISRSTYNCLYQRRYIPLTTSQDLPYPLSDAVVMSRALVHACNWALMNIVTYPELAKVNWVQAAGNHMADYRANMIQAIKQDDEIRVLPPHILNPRPSESDVPGGEYLQSHDTSFLFGGI